MNGVLNQVKTSLSRERTMVAISDYKNTVASRYLLYLFSALILSGCVGSRITESEIMMETIDYPETGVVATKGLGEQLVAKGTRITSPALEVVEAIQFGKKEGEASVLTCAMTVLPGSWFKQGIHKSGSSQADCFGPVSSRNTLADGTTSHWLCNGTKLLTGDICRDNNGKYFLTTKATLTIGATKSYLQQDFDYIRLVRKVVESEPNFMQELIYDGRVGSSLKFVYREFSDDIYRPAFIQYIQYDYSDSSIIEIKDLQFEVIDATSDELTYKLIRNF